MLLTTGGDIVLLGTPQGREGYFYKCFQNKHNRFTVFHVNSEEVITNRPTGELWTKEIRKYALEHLEEEKKMMTKLEYAQEYLGKFVDEFRRFFSEEVILSCMTAESQDHIKPNNTYFMGCDIARMGEDESTYEVIDRTNKELLIHVHHEKTKRTYLTDVSKKILALNQRYDFKNIYIDDGGLGVGVFDYLLDHDDTKSKVIAINNRSRSLDKDAIAKKKILKEDLYNNLLNLMERGAIKLLKDDEIALSFRSVQYEYTNNPKSLTKLKIFGNYTHIVEGLIRACWCNRDKRLNIWCM